MDLDGAAAGERDALGRNLVQQAARSGRHLAFEGAHQATTARGGFEFGKALEAGGESTESGGGVGRRGSAVERGEAGAPQEAIQFFGVGEARDSGFEGLGGQHLGGFVAMRRSATFLNGNLIEEQGGEAFDAPGGAIPFESDAFADAFGEQIEEPGGVDAARDADERGFLVAAIFSFDGDQEFLSGYGAGWGKLRGAAGGQLEVGALAAARHTIRKSREHGHEERIFGGGLATGGGLAKRIDDAAKLADGLGGTRLPLAIEQSQQIGPGAVTGLGGEALTGAEQSGDGATLFGDTALAGFDDEPGEAGMHGVARHFARDGSLRAQMAEQIACQFDGGGGRSVEPTESFERRGADGMEEQRGRREIGPHDLRNVVWRAAREIFQGIEANGATGRGAAGTSGALGGGSLADAGDFQNGQAGPRGMAGDAGQAGIDDDGDAFDGDGAFSDVGGEDDFAAIGRADGAILFFDRLIAVERCEQPSLTRGKGGAGRQSAADFRCAGEKHQDVAFRVACRQPFQRSANLLFQGGSGVRRIFDVEGILAALGAHHARVQILGQGGCLKSGGHDNEAEIGTGLFLQAAEQREREIAFQVALVEFVEDDGSHVSKSGIGKQAAGEDAFGEEAQAGGGPGNLFEANLVADGGANGFPVLGGNEAGGETGGQAAGFEDQDIQAIQGQQGVGNAGGFTGAGRGFDHQILGGAEVLENIRNEGIDGQGHRPLSWHDREWGTGDARV